MKNPRLTDWRFFVLTGVAFLAVGSAGCDQHRAAENSAGVRKPDDRDRIRTAFLAHQSDLWVESEGMVERILPDDNQIPRHQRFILRLAHGQTLLISHNIDLASRIESLQVGDRVRFRGEYEYNEKGGVVHWTHHDPQGRYPGGWIDYKGRRYR